MIRLCAVLAFSLILWTGHISAQSKEVTIANVKSDLDYRYSKRYHQTLLSGFLRAKKANPNNVANLPCYARGESQFYRYPDSAAGCEGERAVCGQAFLLNEANNTKKMAGIYNTANYQSCKREFWGLVERQAWTEFGRLAEKYWSIHNGYGAPRRQSQRTATAPSISAPATRPSRRTDHRYNDIDDLSTDDIEILDDAAPYSPPTRRAVTRPSSRQGSYQGPVNNNPLFQASPNSCRAEPLPRRDIVPDPICICGYGSIDVFGAEAAGGYSECRWGPKWKVESR